MRTVKHSLIAVVVLIGLQYLVLGVLGVRLPHQTVFTQLARDLPSVPPLYADILPTSSRENVIYARRIISDPGIETSLVLLQDARHIRARGHVACTDGEEYQIGVTITQAATGALARGHIHALCNGQVQLWSAKTNARGPNTFALGDALACGVIRTRKDNTFTDAWQWCTKVTLVNSP